MRKSLLFLALFTATLSEARNESDGAEVIHESVVTGSRDTVGARQLPYTVSVVGRASLTENHASSLLPCLSREVPGLFVTDRGVLGYGISSGGTGGISIRGVSGSSGGLVVLIDGHPQYMGIFGHPVADSYQTLLAEKVEVIRGPASVLYGSNAMGGVINIVTRKMEKDGTKTDIDLSFGSFNTLQSEVTNRIRRGRFYSVLSGTYNRTDGHRDNLEFDQYGGHAKLGYAFSDRWKTWAGLNLIHFDSSNPGAVSAPLVDNDSRVTRGNASAAVENDFGRMNGALTLFYNWGRHDIDDGHSEGSAPKAYRYRSDDLMAGASAYETATLFKGNRTTVGADWFHFGGHAWNHFTADGQDKDIADKGMDEVAAYLDFRQDLFTWLTFDAGIRIDRHSVVGTEVVPQGGFVCRLPKGAEIKATVGKGYRNPAMREMYMFPPQNPDLKPERLWNYELAFSQTLDRLTCGINLFRIDADNMISTVRLDGRPKNVNTGKIKNHGAELSASWRVDRMFRLHGNYSFLHMDHPVIAAPEHKAYAGGNFTGGRWSASTGLQYIAGLYTAVGENPQKENFLLWNATVDFKAGEHLTLFAKGENLLAREYELVAGFPMPRATIFAGVQIHL